MKARLAVSLRAVNVRRGDKWVLRGIDWELQPGERWALLGDNGAGKTQLLKLICADIWPTPSRTAANGRTYRVGARTVDLIEAKARIAYIGGEQQDKYARYGWNLTVREIVASGLHQTDLLLSPITPPEARRVSSALLCRTAAPTSRIAASLVNHRFTMGVGTDSPSRGTTPATSSGSSPERITVVVLAVPDSPST